VRYEIEVNGRLRQVTVQPTNEAFRVVVDGKEYALDVARITDHTLSMLLRRGETGSIGSRNELVPGASGRSYEVSVSPDPVTGGFQVRVGETLMAVSMNGRRRWGHREDGTATGVTGPQRIVAPMPGRISRVLVRKGDPVRARQPVVVIEAMKMENELRALADGILAEIHVQDGQSVDAGALLAVIHR
jgi:biotin carboxyl carrier protein